MDQRSRKSRQSYTPNVTRSTAVDNACKPNRALSSRQKRSRSVGVKDRRPLIPGDPRLFSPRAGEHWMDGCLSLADLDKIYMRPWDDCIPSHELSLENLPPFFVRLRDDQAGELIEWLDDPSQKNLPRYRVSQYWPHDITKEKAWFVSGRESWGKPHKGKLPLPGGSPMPSYIDMGLPPTFTSSGKAMRPETETDKEKNGALANSNKRKAGETLTEKVDRNGKRMRTSPERQQEVVQALNDEIAALKARHKNNLNVLTADIVRKEAAIAELQRRDEETSTKPNILNDALSTKETEIQTLAATLQDKTKTITDLETSMGESRIQIQKLEKKHRRQGTELQTLHQKKKEVREARQELEETNRRLAVLRDALEQARSYEEGRDGDIAQRDDRIRALETRLARGKASLERCGEILRREMGGFGD